MRSDTRGSALGQRPLHALTDRLRENSARLELARMMAFQDSAIPSDPHGLSVGCESLDVQRTARPR